MNARSAAKVDRVIEELVKHGLLLESDPMLLSVTRLIVGRSIRGSWWRHPRGRDIWLTTQALADHRDVIVLKLVAGKVTYVHRRLWPAVFTVARANELWQSKGLPAGGRAVLARIRNGGRMRTDEIPRSGWKAAVKDLERRILIISEEIHTASGAHAKVLETWEHWARRRKFTSGAMSLPEAKAQLELATQGLGGASYLLPWHGGHNRR